MIFSVRLQAINTKRKIFRFRFKSKTEKIVFCSGWADFISFVSKPRACAHTDTDSLSLFPPSHIVCYFVWHFWSNVRRCILKWSDVDFLCFLLQADTGCFLDDIQEYVFRGRNKMVKRQLVVRLQFTIHNLEVVLATAPSVNSTYVTDLTYKALYLHFREIERFHRSLRNFDQSVLDDHLQQATNVVYRSKFYIFFSRFRMIADRFNWR